MNMRATLFFSAASAEPAPTFNTLDDVVTLRYVETDDGRDVPAGSHGTVMNVLGDGAAYYVEFAEPEPALALIYADNLRAEAEAA